MGNVTPVIDAVCQRIILAPALSFSYTRICRYKCGPQNVLVVMAQRETNKNVGFLRTN